MTAVNPDEQKKQDEQKREAEKKAKEASKAKEEVKVVNFVRRDLRPGVYSTKALGYDIIIKNRGVYATNKKDEIEFLNDDTELMVLKIGKKKEKK